MSIWLIQRTVEHDTSNGWSAVEEINTNYGYYTTREAAEAAIERIMAPQRETYEAASATYEARSAEAHAKAVEARDLGFAYPVHKWPSRPESPEPLSAIEIQPGSTA